MAVVGMLAAAWAHPIVVPLSRHHGASCYSGLCGCWGCIAALLTVRAALAQPNKCGQHCLNDYEPNRPL
eukprot:scaffold213983_cov31-Tisochrysis_lutea.AAC.1